MVHKWTYWLALALFTHSKFCILLAAAADAGNGDDDSTPTSTTKHGKAPKSSTAADAKAKSSTATNSKAAATATESALNARFNSWSANHVDLILSICVAGLAFVFIGGFLTAWFLKWRHNKAMKAIAGNTENGNMMQIGAPMPTADNSMYPHFNATQPPSIAGSFAGVEAGSSLSTHREIEAMDPAGGRSVPSPSTSSYVGMTLPGSSMPAHPPFPSEPDSTRVNVGNSYTGPSVSEASPEDPYYYNEMPHPNTLARQSVPVSVYSPTDRTRYT